MTENQNLRAIAVLNRDSGTLRQVDCDAFADHLAQRFSEAGRQLSVRPCKGPETDRTLETAAADPDFDTIVAIGGDGTISTAAKLAWRNAKVLGVIPGGTMNLYAQTLGMPLEIFAAADALAHGSVRQADIATANELTFIHQFSVGMQPRVVIERNRLGYRSRFSKLMSSTRAALGAFLNPPAFAADLAYNGATLSGRFSLIAVSNNPYGEGHMPYADRIDTGQLGVYSAPVLSPSENARLAGNLLTGSWRNSEELTADGAQSVTLNFTQLKKSAMASIDGELIPLEARVEIHMHAGELKVIVPAPPTA